MREDLACLLLTVCISPGIRAQTGGAVKCTVVNEHGMPLIKAKVQVVPTAVTWSKVVRFCYTDSKGECTIANVPWGEYRVFASKEEEGYAGIPVPIYGLNACPIVTLQAASPTADATVHLPPKAGAIEPISVVDALTGKELNSASITVRRVADPDDYIGTSTTATPVLVPSNTAFSVQITAAGYKPWPGKELSKDAGHVRLKPEQALKLEVKLAPVDSKASSIGVFSPGVLVWRNLIPPPEPTPVSKALSTTLELFSVRAEDISAVLRRLAHECRVPIGFVASPNGSGTTSNKSLRIDVKAGTVRDVLNAIVAADPTYTWNESDFGAINVVPKDETGSLLDVVVSKYSATNVTPEEAVDHLVKAPEVQRWMEQTGVKRREFAGVMTPPPTASAKIFRIMMKDAPVRRILNAILMPTGPHFWSYHQYGDHNQFFTLTTAD